MINTTRNIFLYLFMSHTYMFTNEKRLVFLCFIWHTSCFGVSHDQHSQTINYMYKCTYQLLSACLSNIVLVFMIRIVCLFVWFVLFFIDQPTYWPSNVGGQIIATCLFVKHKTEKHSDKNDLQNDFNDSNSWFSVSYWKNKRQHQRIVWTVVRI